MVAKRTNIDPPSVAPPLGPYVNAVKVEEPGAFVFVSGCIALDSAGQVVGHGDVAAQARQALTNLGACLEAAGATFKDVVKITNYVLDASTYPLVAPVRAEFLREPYPASTLVEVKGLLFPELLIEIEAIAVMGAEGSDDGKD
jgi:reactive intermediate/imine deaminase